MRAYGFYPGCSMSGSALDYLESSRAVGRALGFELRELEGWFCCGATAGHASDPFLALGLPAGNLRLHQQACPEPEPLVTACAACFNRLKVAARHLREDPILTARIDEIFGPAPDGWSDREVPVLHLLEIFDRELDLDKIRSRASRRPAHRPLKVAAYYGCLLVRPAEIMEFDRPEHPRRIDDLLEACGHEPVDWPHRVECCGAVHGVVSKGVVSRLSERVAEAARDAGADVIAAACPLCQANLDLRQQPPPGRRPIPVMYFTQLLGLTLGLDRTSLGLQRLLQDPEPALAEAGW